MKFRPTSSLTVSVDLRALAAYLENVSEVERQEAADWLNKKLDEWLGQDAFGTEGQCDPRGDHRD